MEGYKAQGGFAGIFRIPFLNDQQASYFLDDGRVVPLALNEYSLGQPTPPEFVDWFAVDRIDGRDIDVGMHRHWVDPMVPFTASVLVPIDPTPLNSSFTNQIPRKKIAGISMMSRKNTRNTTVSTRECG